MLVPRYELTRDELPDCWALHPPVVAELSWLRTAYVQAYLTRSTPQLGADWHTRWRPAVLTRIRELIKPDECSPGKHAPRRGTPDRAGGAERGAAAYAAGRADVLVAVLPPRLTSTWPPPGPRRRGRAGLVPHAGERLSPAGADRGGRIDAPGAATGCRQPDMSRPCPWFRACCLLQVCGVLPNVSLCHATTDTHRGALARYSSASGLKLLRPRSRRHRRPAASVCPTASKAAPHRRPRRRCRTSIRRVYGRAEFRCARCESQGVGGGRFGCASRMAAPVDLDPRSSPP